MRQTIAAAVLFLASAWLRFSNLGAQGLYQWDELYLAAHARIFAAFLRAAPSGGRALAAETARTGGLWHITAARAQAG